jgi:alpha-ribazole phosphatase
VQFFLIRHPRPLIEAGICYGQTDVDTAEAGRAATRLRSLLPALTPLISSPLLRARRLAELLHPQPVYDERLSEIDFGAWEGRRWSEIERASIDAWAANVLHFAPPAGESAAQLQVRAVACVAEQEGAAVVLVTHSGVLRALLGHWLQLPVNEWSGLPFTFGRLTRVDVDASGATLRYMNG